MALDSFEIKYLFELYPNTDFTEEFVSSQEVLEVPQEYDSVATGEKWTWCRDSITANRHIQTYRKRKYEVRITLGRNIDLARMQVAQTTLTTRTGDEFIIYDVNTNYSKVPGRLEYVLEISFYRYDDDIINHLSSDNVLVYKTEQSANVTELSFDVVKPSFSFYSDIEFKYSSDNKFYFQLYTRRNYITYDEYADLNIGDFFYAHVYDPEFDNETDYYVEVIAEDTNPADTILIFEFNNLYGVAQPDFGNTYITIDQTKKELTESSDVENNPVTATYTIYTFLNPVYDFEITETDGNLPFETEENQNTNSKKLAKLKAWLKEDDLYLFEQLHHALPENITLTLSDGSTTIVPQQTKNIITKVDKDTLIRLYEFDILIKYNNKTVPFFR